MLRSTILARNTLRLQRGLASGASLARAHSTPSSAAAAVTPACVGAASAALPVRRYAATASPSAAAAAAGATGAGKSGPFKEDASTSANAAAKMNAAYTLLLETKLYSPAAALAEVQWFFRTLNFDSAYYREFNDEQLAQHIDLVIAAKELAKATNKPDRMKFEATLPGGDTIHFCSEYEDLTDRLEHALETRFFEASSDSGIFSLSMFRSKGAIVDGGAHLLVYVLRKSNYRQSNAPLKETNLDVVATERFLASKPSYVQAMYQRLMEKTTRRLSPTIEVVETLPNGGKQLMMAFRSNESLLAPLSEIFNQIGLVCERKYMERFSNGLRVYSYLIMPDKDIDVKLNRLMNISSLMYCSPRSPLVVHMQRKALTVEEYVYAAAVSRFIYYFITRQSAEYQALLEAFKKLNDTENMSRLTLLHSNLRTAAVTRARILKCVEEHLPLIKELYGEFRQSSLDVKATPRWNDSLAAKIRKTVTSEIDERILLAFVRFNACVLKTNFFCAKKVSLAFRMAPDFIGAGEVPEVPYAVFMVLGSTFQGLHIRFRDVARGGIRLIPFSNSAAYARNDETQFRENYNLGHTQNKKNKDIPEFGAKGTILMDEKAPRTLVAREMAFMQYVSGLLDLVIAPENNIHRGDPKVIADHLGHPELLFLGPDENTADLMEWACTYARYRNYPFWKSITTGKPPSLGGIPHDRYGMTTRSVHTIVVKTLEKLGLDERKVSKLQTGGPDGDLGSNEILLSHDITKSIVDGSGVLHDPIGLNRDELRRLAKMRATADKYDKSLLSPEGFFVGVDQRDVKLPNGELVESGLVFRNEFHLNPLAAADLFVPCGGRPEAVNIQNVSRMFDDKGLPRYKIIVEGANLFITQDARIVLEKAGVVLFRDATANKGGVTSSSLEVLAALAMSDAEHAEHMCLKDASKPPPAFYQQYVQDVQRIIENNAALEFEAIWSANAAGLGHRSLLTDILSDKINNTNDFINRSTLFDDKRIRDAVMAKALPPSLVKLVGMEVVLQRVPPAYTRAVFSSYLASRYVYKYGLQAPEIAFYEFMRTEFGL